MRIKLLCNPSAGRGRAGRHVREAEAYLQSHGLSPELQESSSPDDLTRLGAESSRRGYDVVVVCGGDGTLNLAIRDFDFSQSALGIIPLGSGNDFARVCGIPRSLRESCAVIAAGVHREVDVAVANGRRYLGVAGLGFDSEVARYANDKVRFLRGSLVYLYSILRVLPKFEPHRVRINGKEEEIMFAAIGNSSQYGGGIRITPSALIDDGQLDLCVVHRTSRAQLLKTLPLAYTGAHVRSPFVETSRGSTFEVESEKTLDVFADGEHVTTTPVSTSILPERLRVIVPVG